MGAFTAMWSVTEAQAEQWAVWAQPGEGWVLAKLTQASRLMFAGTIWALGPPWYGCMCGACTLWGDTTSRRESRDAALLCELSGGRVG